MFPFAERHVSSALTGMLNAAVPLFAAIVESGLSRRLPSRGVAGGLAVGMTGAVLMAWPALHQGRSSVVGVLLILAALISYGFAINLARPLQQRNGALPVIWRAQAAALVLTAPLGISDLVHGQWITGPVLSLLALGMLGTGVAYVVVTIAAGRVGSTRASSTAFLIPPVALLLGVLVRHEHVAALSILGAAVCVARRLADEPGSVVSAVRPVSSLSHWREATLAPSGCSSRVTRASRSAARLWSSANA